MHQSRANGCFPFIQVLMVQFCVVVWNFILYPSYYIICYFILLLNIEVREVLSAGLSHCSIFEVVVSFILLYKNHVGAALSFFCIREAFVQCIRAHHFFMVQASKFSWKSIQSSMLEFNDLKKQSSNHEALMNVNIDS